MVHGWQAVRWKAEVYRRQLAMPDFSFGINAPFKIDVYQTDILYSFRRIPLQTKRVNTTSGCPGQGENKEGLTIGPTSHVLAFSGTNDRDCHEVLRFNAGPMTNTNRSAVL